MGNYQQAELNNDIKTMVSGSYTEDAFSVVANRAVRDVVVETDLRSVIRTLRLPTIPVGGILHQPRPADFKAIIDINPITERGRRDQWRLTSPEEFDRFSGNGENLVAIGDTISMSFSDSIMSSGRIFDLIYYSKFGWRNAAGVFIENSTTVSDTLNADIDEYGLITEKTAEYMEQHLKNRAEVQFRLAEYVRKRVKYVMDNPSRALSMITRYDE